jgi:sialate O-acetylesterase
MSSDCNLRPVLFSGLALIFAAMVPPCIAAESPLLSELFQDHAVLQRDRPIPVWGDARPSEAVTVSLGATSVRGHADATGHWKLMLPAMPAGGPTTLTIRAESGATRSASDVLIGDVWLCSGQSNMELPVSASLDSARELANAHSDRIRILTVMHSSAPAPLTMFAEPVHWRTLDAKTVRDFSAACYYFARELAKSVEVPLGLIQSTWGGSAIESWISAPAMRQLEGYADRLDLLARYARDPAAGEQALADIWERWWHARAPGRDPWASVPGDAASWHEVPEPYRDWKTWGVPELVSHDGMVWFRREFTLTAAQAAGAASVSLGAIDEVDQTWVNGRPVGNSFGWGTERTYPVPAGVLHEADNSLTVNVLSVWDAGGMYGPPEHMLFRSADGTVVPLGTKWRYQFVPESYGYPPRAPWQSIGGLTSIYNAMLAPLQPYALRGVAWYQGESNAGDAAHYAALLSAMMADWRRGFDAPLPFLIVQLPNFGAPVGKPAASDWASLREAQRRAVAGDRNAALIVSIDLGVATDLHPPNKQDIGRRLARAARSLIYGDARSPSGPTPLGARRQDRAVVVDFAGTTGALVAHGAAVPVGFELCADSQASCRYAEASLAGTRVTLVADNGSPATRVRFCWGDSPLCNLYDDSGLPAAPFEIAVH